uniref:Proteasome subunit alpha type n=1 Tax=Globodera rostochiensis TaxID=31243 RepID=A0A914ID22_GLORO
MSSIGTGYDLAASTFSPEGRIFQVEYAAKAVDSSVTVIALSCKKGVLVAVDLPQPSKLTLKTANTRIFKVTDHIGLVGSGLHQDLNAVLDYAKDEAKTFLKDNLQPVAVKKLARSVGERVHIFTLGISRPYGVSLFLVQWDKDVGSSIYCVEPSGQCLKYYAWVIGKNAQAAKTEIEKIQDREQLDKTELAKKAIHTLLAVRDEGATGQRVEMAWVGEDSDGKFEVIPQENIDSWEAFVQEEIRAMEQDD